MVRKGVWFVLSIIFCLVGLSFTGCAKSDGTMTEIQSFAMDTYLRVVVQSLSEDQIRTVKDEVVRLESIFDRFSSDSDISRINKSAGEWVEVEPDTLNLLQNAKELAAGTGGYYDPTVGPLAELWKIESQTVEEAETWRPPGTEQVNRVIGLIDYESLVIEPEKSRVSLLQPGMKLDVGGIAKGYAVDRLAELLRSWEISSGLIDFGGDYYALGEHPEGRPWKLGIRHPRDAEEVIAMLEVKDQAVTTSGDYQRFRTYLGQRYSHLLNPKTGYPARGITSVTAVAPTGITADALATAIFVLGPEKGKELVENWQNVEAVIIDDRLEIWISSGLKDKVSFPAHNH